MVAQTSRPGTVTPQWDALAGPRLPVRVVVGFAALALLLEGGSLVCYSATVGFDPRLSVPPVTMLAAGPTGATLIRWGSIGDMLGYLCLVPVAVDLRDRCRGAWFGDLYAIAALVVVVIGSIGAVEMATAAPPLIEQYVTASVAGRQNLQTVFATLYHGVVVGMWQTLETIPAAIWLIGTACAIRRRAPRAVFWILLLVGLPNAALALLRLAGL